MKQAPIKVLSRRGRDVLDVVGQRELKKIIPEWVLLSKRSTGVSRDRISENHKPTHPEGVRPVGIPVCAGGQRYCLR